MPGYRSAVFKVFENYNTIEVQMEAGVKAAIVCQGKNRLLTFDKPVRSLELGSLESLKIAFAILGRIGICETCGTGFRRMGNTGLRLKTRFCSRECFYEWCRKTGHTLGRKKGKNVIEIDR